MQSASRRRTLIGLIAAVVVLLAVSYPWLATNPYYRFVGTMTVMSMALAMSWNIMGGFTGYVSLGHSAFFGLGAYFTGVTVTRLDLPPFAMVVVAGLFVALLAVPIGYLALRTRNASFVIVTLALVYITLLLAQAWRGLTGGMTGLSLPRLEGFEREEVHIPFYFAFLILLAVVFLVTWWISRSRFGMGLIAIREDEDKAEMLGVNTDIYKLTAFIASASFVGIGGGIYAYWFSYIDPTFVFDVGIGLNMILIALFGGVRSIFGPMLGALIIVPSSEYFLAQYGASQLHLMATGLLLGIVVVLMPQGIIPAVESVIKRLRAPAPSIRESPTESAPPSEPTKAAS
ncbi:MAG: branched-chain amino acid ABC transporter permease [Actinomycetota bacterium]